MAPLFLAAVLAQAGEDPRIESVERLTGPAERPRLWCPLRITLSSARGFRGDLSVSGTYGVTVARAVEVAAGGRGAFLLPALDPLEVAAGETRQRVVQRGVVAEHLIGVDERLPYADALASGGGRVFRKLSREAFEELLPGGALEAFDALLLADAAGLPLAGFETTGAWAVAPAREGAEAFLAGLPPARPRVGAHDDRLAQLAPEGGWVPAKKNFLLFFVTVYVFAGFAALIGIGLRRPRAGVAVAGGTALAFMAIYAFAFPSGHLWITEYACEVASADGRAAEWRVWFVRAGADRTVDLRFSRLVKPVFPAARGADVPFTIRAGGKGSIVEGLKLAPGSVACFAGVEERAAPSLRALPSLSAPLYRASVLLENRNRFLGDLPAGATLPERVGEDEPAPREPDFTLFASRFVAGDSLFGWLARGEGPARDVHSPDVADQREKPRFFLQRLK